MDLEGSTQCRACRNSKFTRSRPGLAPTRMDPAKWNNGAERTNEQNGNGTSSIDFSHFFLIFCPIFALCPRACWRLDHVISPAARPACRGKTIPLLSTWMELFTSRSPGDIRCDLVYYWRWLVLMFCLCVIHDTYSTCEQHPLSAIAMNSLAVSKSYQTPFEHCFVLELLLINLKHQCPSGK